MMIVFDKVYKTYKLRIQSIYNVLDMVNTYVKEKGKPHQNKNDTVLALCLAIIRTHLNLQTPVTVRQKDIFKKIFDKARSGDSASYNKR